MDRPHNTVERGQQMLVSLLKQHNIKKVIASPGATNAALVWMLMNDSWFEVYSCVDERSAAYMACGMAQETEHPVVLTCTGATSSRNYMPGITEAYYRKLPILAVTATINEHWIGHLHPQLLDRGTQPSDTYVKSVHVPVPHNSIEEWSANLRINDAILALTRHGGGPVHINLATDYNNDFSVANITDAVCIRRWYANDELLPDIPYGRIGIKVGNHKKFSSEEIKCINAFCEEYGAIVFCEHGSNYVGPYRIYSALMGSQSGHKRVFKTELLIHIGETGAYGTDVVDCTKRTWRVSPDGELRDKTKHLTDVFEMNEIEFFSRYTAKSSLDRIKQKEDGRLWLNELSECYQMLLDKIGEIPFSNVWIAQKTANKLPQNSTLHVGILNSQRSWTMFEPSEDVRGNCFVNTGGFGIDGCLSTAIGAAIANPKRIHFLVIGDLAFFYDMNALGCRHLPSNIRILLINNGKGAEFKMYNHLAAKFGEATDEYIAAAGHFGNKSDVLVRHYAEDLNIKYLKASNKKEYLLNMEEFLSEEHKVQPLIFEIFTSDKDEDAALHIVNNLWEKDWEPSDIKQILSKTLPVPIKNILRKIIKR